VIHTRTVDSILCGYKYMGYDLLKAEREIDSEMSDTNSKFKHLITQEYFTANKTVSNIS
jgi:hypothetical protein